MWEWLIAAALAAGVQAESPAARSELVALVGDSITFEHQDVIERAFLDCNAPRVVIDAQPGRVTTTSSTPLGEIESGLEAIEAIRSTSDPSTWLIELGVNDVNVGRVPDEAAARSVIDSVLDLVDEDDTVYWVDLYTVGDRADRAELFNRVLRSYDRIDVLDWADKAPSLVYDGLHPTAEGAAVMAGEYCRAITR